MVKIVAVNTSNRHFGIIAEGDTLSMAAKELAKTIEKREAEGLSNKIIDVIKEVTQ